MSAFAAKCVRWPVLLAMLFMMQRAEAIIKCDMCKGDPECVRFCPNEALTYVEDTIAVRARKKAFAAKFKEPFKEVS